MWRKEQPCWAIGSDPISETGTSREMEAYRDGIQDQFKSLESMSDDENQRLERGRMHWGGRQQKEVQLVKVFSSPMENELRVSQQ